MWRHKLIFPFSRDKMEWTDFPVFLCFPLVSELKICAWSPPASPRKSTKESSTSMLENFFKGEVPSIFETTIKREKGSRSEDNSPTSRLKNYRNEEEFLRSVKATICYCGSFWTFGMAAAVIGPTLLELGCVTNRPLNVMSWVFFSQALSALFGSSIGGFLADRYIKPLIYLMVN